MLRPVVPTAERGLLFGAKSSNLTAEVVIPVKETQKRPARRKAVTKKVAEEDKENGAMGNPITVKV